MKPHFSPCTLSVNHKGGLTACESRGGLYKFSRGTVDMSENVERHVRGMLVFAGRPGAGSGAAAEGGSRRSAGPPVTVPLVLPARRGTVFCNDFQRAQIPQGKPRPAHPPLGKTTYRVFQEGAHVWVYYACARRFDAYVAQRDDGVNACKAWFRRTGMERGNIRQIALSHTYCIFQMLLQKCVTYAKR